MDLNNKFYISNDVLKNFDDSLLTYYGSPHFSNGRNICDFVVIHWTGTSRPARSSVNWTQDHNSNVSFHLCIDRDGTVYVNNKGFRSILWHCGNSSYKAKLPNERYRDYKGINRYGIGIELANAGRVDKENGVYVDSFGSEVKNVKQFNGKFYEDFTENQLKVCGNITKLLCANYKCVDVVGHYEISPGRKIDPGPLFPLKDLRKMALNKRG